MVLQESDDLLRTLFFSIVKETTGTDFYESLVAVYELSEKFHESQSDADFKALADKLGSLDKEESMMLASAFSNILNLHNVSEHLSLIHI